MKVKELRDVIKPIKNASSLYLDDGYIKFIFPNHSVYGFIDDKFDFNGNFMLAYLQDLYNIIDDKKILDNDIVITDEMITDSKNSFEYPLFEDLESNDIEIYKPKDMLPDLDLKIKIKYDELKFTPDGAYIEKNGANYKKRVSENKHDYYVSISYNKKLELLPKTIYEYKIGNDKVILKHNDTYDIYYYVTIDSISESKTNSIIDSYLDDLDFD